MSSLWIAAQEKIRGIRHWHVHRRKILFACLLLALLIWLFATTVVRAQGL
jgi:hypothetical protein